MGNIKFKGKVFLEKLDINTYDVIETLPVEENDISISTINQYMINTYPMYLPPQRTISTFTDRVWRIYWSSSLIKQDILTLGVPIGVQGSETIGNAVDCNIGYPVYTQKSLPTDKDYLTFVADILPGTSTRTINSLALGNNYNLNEITSVNGNMFFTNLNLSTPCIQDNLTVIRVTYRLYFDDPVPSTGYSEFSDGVYDFFISNLIKVGNGTISGNATVNTNVGPDYISSSFYDPSVIDNYKTKILVGNSPYLQIASDFGISFDISPLNLIWNQDTLTYTFTTSLTDAGSQGVFFRTMNFGGGGGTNIYNSAGFTIRYSNVSYLYKKLLDSNVTPIKNVFKQTSAGNTPFQDLSTIGTMTGSITLDASGWNTQAFPKIFKVNINNTGDNSTATYNYEVGTFAGGFMENTFSPRTVVMPQDGNNLSYNYHRKKVKDNDILRNVLIGGTVVRSPDDIKYFVAVNCQCNQNSISYYNIETGNKYILDSTTTPALPVTNTSDMAVSNGYTFVTCSNTGLWKISPDFNTVTNINSIGGTIDSSKAYQIDVKDNGDLWVLFEGGLAKGVTPDNGVSWNWTVYDTTTSPVFSATGITNSNWSNVTAMCVDPEHTNDRILFVLGSAASTNNYAAGFIWWEGLTGTTTIMTSGVPYPSFSLSENLKRSDLIKCAGGYWFTSAVNDSDGGSAKTMYKAQYSNTTWSTNTTYSGIDGKLITATINNVKSCIIGSMSTDSRHSSFVIKNSSISSLPSTLTVNMAQNEFSLINGSSVNIADYRTGENLFIPSHPITYLKKSNMLICYNINANVFYFSPIIPPTTAVNYNDYKDAFWKKYGWDGSNWVLNNSSSKTCHIIPNTLHDGLQISFNNGVSGTSFINTEKFIFVVGNGVMKDNATQLDTKFTFSPWETELVTDLFLPGVGQVTTVPSKNYGAVVDEPITFSNLNPSSTTALAYLMCKGKFTQWGSGYVADVYISCEEIQANATFSIKFKLGSSLRSGPTVNSYITLYDGSTSIATIRHNTTTGDLYVTDGYSYASMIGSAIPRALLDINKTFEIVRLFNNTILFIYDGIVYAAKNNNSRIYLYISNDNNNSVVNFKGFYDMTISYTDYRRMLLIGNQSLSTGKFNNKFLHTSVNGFLTSTKCIKNNIPQTIVFTPQYASTLGANQVRMLSGSGYLVFSDMPTASVTTSGATTIPLLKVEVSGGVVTNVVIEKNGSGFTSTPTLTISAPETGTTATATVTLDATNSVNDLVTITNAGSGYTPGIYPLSITGGGGSGATGNVYISTTGVVVAIDITNGGSNYTSTPTLSFSGAGTPTVNAVLTAAIGKRISSITITNGGSGYIPDAGTSITANTIAMYHP